MAPVLIAPTSWEVNYYGLTGVALGGGRPVAPVRLEVNYYGLTAVALGISRRAWRSFLPGP